MVVLDTDHITLLEWASKEAQRLKLRLEQAATEEQVTTIVSYEEQTRGWLAYVSRARTLVQQIDAYKKLSRHLDVYRPLRLLEFDERSAAQFQ